MSEIFERVREIPIEAVIREYFPSLELKRSGHDLRRQLSVPYRSHGEL